MTEEKKEWQPIGEAEKIALTADFGKVFIKRTSGGEILRPIKAHMTLTDKDGHLYTFKGGRVSPTATGYTQLNKIASVSILTPATIVMDGIEKPNPYVERNPKTRAIETVNIRKIGVGYSPAGNIVVIDKSLYYNIYTYLIQSIQAKMKRTVWEWDKKANRRVDTGKLENEGMAEIGTIEDRPETTDKAKWVFLLTADPLGIWINYKHQEIQSIMEEHTQRQRFGDRIAQTIVERNILKDHPAIGISQVDATEITPEKGKGKPYLMAQPTVYGYRTEMNARDIVNIMVQAERGDGSIPSWKEEIRDPDPQEEKIAMIDAEVEDAEPRQKEPEPPKPDQKPADAGSLFTKTKKA